jgi:phosphohistidine phosphatase SixA/8-oxo-dGTP pyrophosphatase MutT (NUDIX family)
MTSAEILAAGTLPWRRDEFGQVEIALVHRPKYDDWSFPKGKLEHLESPTACAYRETLEETGFEVRFHNFLGEVSYQTPDGIKRVKYWSAKFLQEMGKPNTSEVDQVLWFNPAVVREKLNRDSDKEILDRFLATDLDSKVLILLRHAKAVAREEWQNEDLDRPLATFGEQQSKRLISALIPYSIKEIHSSSAVRCYETINPLARALSLDYFFTDSLTEFVFERNPSRTLKYIDRLLENEHTTLICGHNPILPKYLAEKYSRQGFEVSEAALKPGEAWILHHIGKEVIAVDHLPAPIIA